MSKTISALVKLQIAAGKANPAPPIGTVLGPKGVNIMNFCKEFNAQTASFPPNEPVRVLMTIYSDKSFIFEIKKPPMSYLLKKAAGITSGSKITKRGDFVGKITESQVKEVAISKMQDLKVNTIEAAIKMTKGTAASIGIEIVA